MNNIAGDNSNPDDHSIGVKATVSGGNSNTASGELANVSGGIANTASGYSSSVSAGYYRSVSGDYDWRAGSLFEDQ